MLVLTYGDANHRYQLTRSSLQHTHRPLFVLPASIRHSTHKIWPQRQALARAAYVLPMPARKAGSDPDGKWERSFVCVRRSKRLTPRNQGEIVSMSVNGNSSNAGCGYKEERFPSESVTCAGRAVEMRFCSGWGTLHGNERQIIGMRSSARPP